MCQDILDIMLAIVFVFVIIALGVAGVVTILVVVVGVIVVIVFQVRVFVAMEVTSIAGLLLLVFPMVTTGGSLVGILVV